MVCLLGMELTYKYLVTIPFTRLRTEDIIPVAELIVIDGFDTILKYETAVALLDEVEVVDFSLPHNNFVSSMHEGAAPMRFASVLVAVYRLAMHN